MTVRKFPFMVTGVLFQTVRGSAESGIDRIRIRWKASSFLLNIPEILWDTPSATGSCIAVLRSDCGTIPVPGRGKSPSPCGMLHSSGPLPLQKVKSGVTFHSQARNT